MVLTALRDDLKPSFKDWRASTEQRRFDCKEQLDMEDQGYIAKSISSRLQDMESLTNW